MANTKIFTMLATTAVLALTACGGGSTGGGGSVPVSLTINDFQEVQPFGQQAALVSLNSVQPAGNYSSLVITDEPEAFSNGYKVSAFDPENLTITSTIDGGTNLTVYGYADFEGQRYVAVVGVMKDGSSQIVYAEPVTSGSTWDSVGSGRDLPNDLTSGYPTGAVMAATSEQFSGSLPISGSFLYAGKMIMRYDNSIRAQTFIADVDFGLQQFDLYTGGAVGQDRVNAENVQINMVTGQFLTDNVDVRIYAGGNFSAQMSGQFVSSNGDNMQGLVVDTNAENPGFMAGFVGQRK